MYDVIIVGGGPAGMNAAIYLSRMGKDVAIVEGGLFGGQLNNTEEVENYLGFTSIDGQDLAEQMEEHMNEWINEDNIFDEHVTVITKEDNLFFLHLGLEEVITSKFVILATGAKHKKLGVPGENLSGVSYCAVCDGMFFKNKNVIVVGGGNSAIEEAIYLAEIVDNVTVVHRRDELRADSILIERAKSYKNIHFEWSYVIESINGEEKVESVNLVSTKNEENKTVDIDGVFIYIGVNPVYPEIEIPEFSQSIGEDKFLLTNSYMETSVDGLFAIGDIREDSPRQIISAAGDSAVASKKIFDKSLEK